MKMCPGVSMCSCEKKCEIVYIFLDRQIKISGPIEKNAWLNRFVNECTIYLFFKSLQTFVVYLKPKNFGLYEINRCSQVTLHLHPCAN